MEMRELDCSDCEDRLKCEKPLSECPLFENSNTDPYGFESTRLPDLEVTAKEMRFLLLKRNQ